MWMCMTVYAANCKWHRRVTVFLSTCRKERKNAFRWRSFVFVTLCLREPRRRVHIHAGCAYGGIQRRTRLPGGALIDNGRNYWWRTSLITSWISAVDIVGGFYSIRVVRMAFCLTMISRGIVLVPWRLSRGLCRLGLAGSLGMDVRVPLVPER